MVLTQTRILLSKLKFLSFDIVRFTAGLVWRKALNRHQSIEILQDYIVSQYQDQPLAVKPCQSVDQVITLSLEKINSPGHLTPNEIQFEPNYVWQIPENKTFKSLSLSRSGIAILNNKYLLDLDYGNTSGYKESPIKFKTVEYSLVVAPWSHLTSFSYFGFVALILTKLCRIENALGQEIWQNAKLCYPLYHTNYEKEYLQKLGIPDIALVDTRNKGLKIKAKTLILANNQTHVNRISPHDIQLLRNRLIPDQKGENYRKLFFPRRGKRIIENEAEVRALLIEFGFEIIEDINRTVEEQITLYQSASVIIAPHGAGLTNLLWCNPGTQVIELFYGGYQKAGFYYICQVLGLNYSCIFDHDYSVENFVNQFHNMKIDVKVLQKRLKEIIIIKS